MERCNELYRVYNRLIVFVRLLRLLAFFPVVPGLPGVYVHLCICIVFNILFRRNTSNERYSERNAWPLLKCSAGERINNSLLSTPLVSYILNSGMNQNNNHDDDQKYTTDGFSTHSTHNHFDE